MRNRYKISAIIILLLSIILFSYSVTKSTISSFTHDESFSYLRYVSHSFMDIISNKDAYSNNHVFNTLCMKYSEKIFGNSEIALRLPNLILLLVYLTYTFLFFHKSNPVLCVSIFILMTTNTPLIDFFGLARGYGMSIGFMVMSLYHLINSFNNNKNKHLILFNIGALLAILSNFTMLNFYLASLLVFNLLTITECRFISKEKYSFYKTNRVNIIMFIFLLIILYEPVRKFIKFNTFDFGGKQGFLHDTVSSLIYRMFTNIWIKSNDLILLQISILLIILISLIIIIVNTYRSDKEFFSQSRALIIVNLILLTISIETIVQHWVLKTDYLIDRFALFLFPLFVLNIGFLFEYILKFRYRFIIQSLVVSLAILSISNFYRNRNLFSDAEWGYDMETKNAVTALINYQQNVATKKDNIKLGINWVFEPTINYYRQTWNIHWLLPVDRNGMTESDDYYYIFNADLEKLKNKNYQVIFSSERTHTMLIKNNIIATNQ